jgi:signal transduction histidine kinase
VNTHHRPLEDLLKYITIYVVDDHNSFRKSVVKRLQALNYDCVWDAANCEEALQDKNLAKTDILLTDQIFSNSEMTGLEMVRTVKERYGDKIEVILYSGNAKDIDKKDAILKGATSYLQKGDDLQFDYLKLWLDELGRRIWLQKVLDELPDSVAVYDLKYNRGNVLYINETKARKYLSILIDEGVKIDEKDIKKKNYKNEFIKRKCYLTFSISDNPGYICTNCPDLKAYREKKTIRTEWQYLSKKNNKINTTDLIVSPLYDHIGKVRAVNEACRDLTDKNRIEELIKNIEEEQDWEKRLIIFLKGFESFDYIRARFYLIDEKYNKEKSQYFRGIKYYNMPTDYKMESYQSNKDISTKMLLEQKTPLVFKVDTDNPDRPYEKDKIYNYLYYVGEKNVKDQDKIKKKEWIELPIIINRKIIGKVVIDTGEKQPNKKRKKEKIIPYYILELFGRYVNSAGQAIDNARKRSLIELREKIEKTTIDMAKEITTIHDPEQLFKKAVKHVCEVMDVCTCSIFLFDKSKNILERNTSYGRTKDRKPFEESDFMQEQYEPGKYKTGQVFQTGDATYENEVQQIIYSIIETNKSSEEIKGFNIIAVNYYSKKIGEPQRNAIFAPLQVENNKIGVLRALHKLRMDHFGGRDFDDDDLTAFQALAGLIAIAINNSRIMRQLENAKQAKADLINLYSHSLKNRIQPLDLLTERFKRGNTGELENKILISEMSRLKTVADTMLLVSRQEAGTTIIPKKESINLYKLIEDTVEVYKMYAEDKLMNIEISPQDNFSENFFLDREMIRDAVINLLDNAIIYGKENSNIMVELEIKNSDILIKVSNEGSVINQSEQKSIFKQYYKSKESTGTGIGLAHVKLVSEAHGGRAFVNPDYNKGVQIIIVIKSKSNKSNKIGK